ncbi:protein FLX-like 4 [Diospyros lotus]|uniref:protein FLX-like 4 n=1 Tax=Diospyros lotus TaxID=55363 RepID=UPI002259F31D|nr:protein FLX-like 4 [Diospyros lotus]XP_052181611.1 protein FLX-like 4 [Diospyros lotus]XP_052181612.1 protein FLX-like 4 [Diospyros lotus]
MAGRGHLPSTFERRYAQAPGMMRRPLSGMGPAGHHPLGVFPREHLESDMAIQEEEMEQLARGNEILAASHAAMRQELVAVQQEIEAVKAHIRSTETESDIQIRVLLEKSAKMEAKMRAVDGRKKDLQQAHMEARSLATTREDLTAQIRQATDELDKANADLKTLSEMKAELDRSREEHQRLRTTFEHEKRINMEKVEELRAAEKKLVGMAREVEMLRAAISDAENRARSPNRYGMTYKHGGPLYPPSIQNSGAYGYSDRYRRQDGQMGIGAASEGMIPYAGGSRAAASGGAGGSTVPGAGGASAWGGAYEAPPHP